MAPSGFVGITNLQLIKHREWNLTLSLELRTFFASLSGGKLFTKLDLAHAYNQIPLDEESKKLVVINTQKGLYKYNRLPFGIASAPALFQRTIEGILQGIPNVYISMTY